MKINIEEDNDYNSNLYDQICNNSKEKVNLEAQYKNYDFDIFTIEEPDKENLDDIAKEIIKEKIEKIIKRNSETKDKCKEKDKKDIDKKQINSKINKTYKFI